MRYEADERITTEYKLKISSNTIIQTEVREWKSGRLDNYNIKKLDNLKDNTTKGLISKKSKAKLKKSINWLIMSSQQKKAFSLKTNHNYQFKVNFITLTIPPQKDQLLSEKQVKSILNTWLTYHRKYSKLNNYVWKIEKHKDNRLHIHITTDTYIHHKSVKDSWNLILQRAGFLEYHFGKFSNYSPNSTDVHAIKKVKKLAAYVVKYMAKSNKKDKLYRGRVWSCSLKISKVLNNELYVTPDKIGSILRVLFEKNIKSKSIETEPDAFGRTFVVAEMYLLSVKDWISLKGSFLYDYFKEIILFLRYENNNYRQESLVFQAV